MILNDQWGEKIGEMVDEGDLVVLNDVRGKKLGTYNKKTDTTLDLQNVKVGTGNTLAILLAQASPQAFRSTQ